MSACLWWKEHYVSGSDAYAQPDAVSHPDTSANSKPDSSDHSNSDAPANGNADSSSDGHANTTAHRNSDADPLAAARDPCQPAGNAG